MPSDLGVPGASGMQWAGLGGQGSLACASGTDLRSAYHACRSKQRSCSRLRGPDRCLAVRLMQPAEYVVASLAHLSAEQSDLRGRPVGGVECVDGGADSFRAVSENGLGTVHRATGVDAELLRGPFPGVRMVCCAQPVVASDSHGGLDLGHRLILPVRQMRHDAIERRECGGVGFEEEAVVLRVTDTVLATPKRVAVGFEEEAVVLRVPVLRREPAAGAHVGFEEEAVVLRVRKPVTAPQALVMCRLREGGCGSSRGRRWRRAERDPQRGAGLGGRCGSSRGASVAATAQLKIRASTKRLRSGEHSDGFVADQVCDLSRCWAAEALIFLGRRSAERLAQILLMDPAQPGVAAAAVVTSGCGAPGGAVSGAQPGVAAAAVVTLNDKDSLRWFQRPPAFASCIRIGDLGLVRPSTPE